MLPDHSPQQLYKVQLLVAVTGSSSFSISLLGLGIIRFSVFLLIWSSAFSWFLVCLRIISLCLFSNFTFLFCDLFLFCIFFCWFASPPPFCIFSSLYILATYLLLIFYISNMFSQRLIFYGVLCCVQVYILIKSYLLVCSFMVGAFCIMFNKSCRTLSTLGSLKRSYHIFF